MSDTKCVATKKFITPDSRKNSLSDGLVMIPTNVRKMASFSTNHKRMGSTGTTGDESYTTDDEDEPDIDEPDFVVKHFDNSNYGTYSTISTITDKLAHSPHHDSTMQRNSSDISVYSGLNEKCDDDDNESANLNNESSSWTSSSSKSNCDQVDKFTFTELKSSLREAYKQLEDHQEEIHKLTRSKTEVEAELEDLTASLFQEAHNMVREANEKQSAAERALKESEMKVEVLMAEVAALKTLVLTSTPSRPNPHLHPQIDKNKDEVVTFSKKLTRSPSHSAKTEEKSSSPTHCEVTNNANNTEIEVDPILYNEFVLWKDSPKIDKTSTFIERIYKEDIDLCLSFTNAELSDRVLEAVENGVILIEPIGEKSKAYPRTCALMEDVENCSYKINLGNGCDEWYYISQICRNRITTVCDFLNYLKYIERGLVKSSAQDIYCELMKLRRNMVLSKFGFRTNL